MKKRTWIVILVSVLLTAAIFASAAQESEWKTIFEAGRKLLFATDNVTLEGTAEFSMNGEHFKTMKTKYVQAGYDSLLDYTLLTPFESDFGEHGEKKTGYLIVANTDDEYEFANLYAYHYYNDLYKTGSDDACDSLVRTSPAIEAAVRLAGVVFDQAGQWLGESALQVVRSDDTGRTLHIQVNEQDVPELANVALTLCAQHIINRAFKRTDYDSNSNYGLTTAGMIAADVRSYALKSADVTVEMDAAGRLTGLKGSVSVNLFFMIPRYGSAESNPEDGTDCLDVSFDISIGSYGDSHVEAFDPAAYGISLPR